MKQGATIFFGKKMAGKIKTRIPLLHFGVPVLFIYLFTVWTTPDSGLNPTLVFTLGLLLFSAPHIFWSLVLTLAKPSQLIKHAGYIGASLALLITASMPPNSSGFLDQWLNYWRLASWLMLVSVGLTFAVRARYTQ